MKNKRGLFWIYTGLLLIVAALVIVGYNYWEDQQAAQSVASVMEQLTVVAPTPKPTHVVKPAQTVLPSEEEIPDYILNPAMEMPTETIDGYDYIGVVEVPASEIELPVISQWSYPALKRAPCRFDGSAYTDDMILAAHTYNAHFRRLRELSGGEEVTFTDTAGNEFSYEVVSVETINGTDLEGLMEGEWDLILFTCTASGSARIVVRCERIEDAL